LFVVFKFFPAYGLFLLKDLYESQHMLVFLILLM
jgi:hypothetical protein